MRTPLITLIGLWLFSVSNLSAQVSIIGPATPSENWQQDYNMTQDPTNNNRWFLEITLTDAFVKFRKDGSWVTNWGAEDFPSGIGVQDGNNIPVSAAGDYFVTFNETTGEYTFTDLSGGCSFPNTLYVDVNVSAASDSSGSSWDNATPSLQKAIDIAHNTANIENIYIAKGVYNPEKSICADDTLCTTFFITKPLNIIGGFQGGECDPSQRTFVNGRLPKASLSVLSGDLGFNDNSIQGITTRDNDIQIDENLEVDNVYHVMILEGVGTDMILDGLVFTGGYATKADEIDFYNISGGGLLNDGRFAESSPQVKNCLFQGNVATQWGGGILNVGLTMPTFENCEFIYNASYLDGGGFYNMADEGFLAATIEWESSPTIINSRFAGNTASFSGAGLYNNGDGGGVSSPKIIQCIFTGNKAGFMGAGLVYNGLTSTGMILNSTFSSNLPNALFTDRANIEIDNSIIFGNGEILGSQLSGDLNLYTVRNTILPGAKPPGTNIYDFDPLFVDPVPLDGSIPTDAGDYNVQECSPIVNVGDRSIYDQLFPDNIDYNFNSRAGVSIDLGPFEQSSTGLFTATKFENDAYIDLNWTIERSDCNCFEEDPILKKGVTVQLKSNNSIIESWVIFPEDITDAYSFSYRDEVGPDINKSYALEFKRTGPGTLNCQFNDQGGTTPFIQPEHLFISQGETPDSLILKWRNKSKLTSGFKIYRDGVLVNEIVANDQLDTDFEFNDIFKVGNETSIVNGQEYTYCIETKSDIYKSIYNTDVPIIPCNVGLTYNIGLEASDDGLNEKVDLTWQPVDAFTEQIRITRNEEVIGTLPGTSTSFTDIYPVPGQVSVYGVELMKFNAPFVGSYDEGSIPANGSIVGYVNTSIQKVPVKDVVISLSWQEDGNTFSRTDTTLFDGSFLFDDLFYGEEREFTLEASLDSAEFTENPILVTLNLNEPRVFDTRFYVNGPALTDTLHYADVNFFNVTQDLSNDATIGSWQFAKSNPTDTVYFNYYRETTLLNQIVDAQSTLNNISYSYVDKDGIPGETYTYHLYAYVIENGELRDTTISRTVIFPEVSIPQNLVVIPNNTRRTVDISWTNNSNNITGYKVYRDQLALQTIYNGGEKIFTDLTGAANQGADYYVTSYRTVNGIDYESQPTPVVNVLYPDFTAVNNLVITPIDDEDKINLIFTPPSVYNSDYNYDGFKVYRRETGLPDSEFVIRTLNKQVVMAGDPIIFDDFSGKPEVDYTYDVRPFIQLEGINYESIGNNANVVYPVVSAPLFLVTSSDTSKIILNWDSPYRSENVEGFIIAKGALPNQDTIGLVNLKAVNTFTDYVNKTSVQLERYEVSSIRVIEGDTFYSSPTIVFADPPLSNGGDAIFLSNVTATRDITSHIKLCWEWSDPATETPFIIRRNGEIIAAEPFSSRAYFDYDAPIGVEVEYSIETPGVLGNLDFLWLYTSGFRPSNKSAVGRVYESASQRGIENVDIDLDLSKTSDRYRFPRLQTQDLTVTVVKLNIDDDTPIADIDLKITSTHTFFQELVINLVSPAGTTVEIMNLSTEPIQCFGNGLELIFDDNASNLHNEIDNQCSGDNTVQGIFKPLQALQSLNGESLSGEWTLTVEDIYNADSGEVDAELLVTYENKIEIYSAQTRSDASGYYRIDDLPFNQGIDYEMVLSADSTNNRFIQNPISLLINDQDSTPSFEINFVDTLMKEDGSNLAEILNITTSPNDLNMSIGISWSPSNDNYEGFELYRNSEFLVEVLRGSPLFIQDFDGFPGLLATYSVRAFNIVQGEREYSSFLSSTNLFPDLRPIENISAIPISADNKIELRWSHPTDNHDFYLVTRNGEPFDVVPAGNRMISIDTTGTPGQLYRYEVFSVLGSYSSLGVSTSEIYPLPEPIRNFTLSIPPGNSGQGENHVLVEWNYNEDAANAFNLVRYIDNGTIKDDEKVIARLEGDIRSYRDYEGIPNQLYHYEVVPVLLREGIEYVAARRTAWSENIVFPLIAPTGGNFVYNSYGTISINAIYDYPGADGIEFYRNEAPYESQRFTEETFPKSVIAEDPEGTPATVTAYAIRAFSERGGEVYYSNFTRGSIIYPNPPVPANFQATDYLYPNKISLTWEYDLRSSLDEFKIERNVNGSGWELITSLTPGERTYDDFLNFSIEQTNDIPIVYRISAINKGVASDFAQDEGSLYSGKLVESFETDTTQWFGGSDAGASIDISGDHSIYNFAGGFCMLKKDTSDWFISQIFRPAEFGLNIITDFAKNVAISGDLAVVSSQAENLGNGLVVVLRKVNGLWIEDAKINAPSLISDFGLAVDIYDDPSPSGKDLLIVSGNNPFDSGSVLLYERVNGNWVLRLNRQGPNAGGRYGALVTISKDYSIIYQQFSDEIGLHSIIHSNFSEGPSLVGNSYNSIDLRGNQLVTARSGGIVELHTIRFSITLDETLPVPGSVASKARILSNEILVSNTIDQVAYVLSRDEFDEWSVQQELLPFPGRSSFGRSIALSSEFFMISSMGSNGNGYVDFYPRKVIRLGESVDIDGDWAVAGTNGNGFVIYQKRDDNTWVVHQKFGLDFNEVVAGDGFGKSVAISGKYIAVGAPYDEQNSGAVYMFEKSADDIWGFTEKIIDTDPFSSFFGQQVELVDNDGLGESDFLYVQFKTNFSKFVTYAYRRESNIWNNFVQLIRGRSFVFNQGGSKTIASRDKILFIQGSAATLYRQSDFSEADHLNPGSVRRAWAIAEDIVIGVGNDRLYHYDISSESFVLINELGVVSPDETYGQSVAVSDGRRFAVGAPGIDQVFLYRATPSISPTRSIENESIDGLSSFGHDIAISGNFMIVGAPGFNNNKGKIHFEEVVTLPPPPTNVSATDGTQTGQVTITWDEPSESGNVDGYNIFRDGEFLANIGSGDGLSYVDLPPTGLIPGKVYIYQVQSTFNDLSSKSIGDSGFMPPNGRISGKLTTLQGNAPIEGGIVTAEVLVDGDYRTYTAMTNQVGDYVIEDIYYGDRSTFTLRCEYLDHKIISQESANANPQLEEIELVLEIINNEQLSANFFDITAFSITGNVRHNDIEDCFIDSIRLVRKYIINEAGSEIIQEESKFTDENGEYAFIIDPELDGLEKIEIIVNDTLFSKGDPVLHEFVAITDESIVPIRLEDGIPEITDFNLEINTTIDFRDMTEYTTTINIVNTCGDVLSDGDIWTIKVKSLDGCYEETFLTSPNNTISPSLPPRSMVINVIDVNNKSPENLIFLDYLINNPMILELDSIHINEASSLSQQELLERTTVNLEYHKPPVITADFSSFQFLCDDEDREMIIQSGEDYAFSIDVVELFSPVCAVSSGYLKVVNDASSDELPVILEYDPTIQGFPEYTFTAGSPNPVIPHSWNISIEYYSDGGNLQGSISSAFIVEGSFQLPGNGIITDSGDELNEVPLPLFILRDPPGDRSYSSISQGNEVTKTFSFQRDLEASGSVGSSANAEVGFLGVQTSANISGGVYNVNRDELSLTTLVTETISTDGGIGTQEELIGRDASIIVGVGVVMQTGIQSSIAVDPNDCDRIIETRSVGFTPIKLQTTWTYTVQFIEDLIEQYEQDLIAIENNQLLIDNLSKEEAIAKYQSLKLNWEKVIKFYDEETNPLYYFTAVNFTDKKRFEIFELEGDGGTMTSLNEEANKWSDRLRRQFPISVFEGTQINSILDQNLLDQFNNAATAIRELMSYDEEVDDFLVNTDLKKELYDRWKYSDARFDNLNYYTSVPGISENEMGENRTFSGLTNQLTTIQQSKTGSKSSSMSFFVSRDTYSKITIGTGLTTFTGIGAGVISKIFDVSASVELSTEVGYRTNETTGNSTTETAEVSYFLSDSDPTDEFSVTVLNSVDLNHTPFFQLIGGQSSCPHEPGTLNKDNPKILVLNPDSGAAGNSASLQFQDPDQPAEFTITITNLSNTQDTRDIEVFLDNNSNPNGATVTLGGATLGAQVYTELGYNNPLQLTLLVERGQAFDYSGLRIGVRPACEGNNVEEFITLNVEFQSPCSPVSIIQPDDSWLINSASPELIVGLQDYEPNTPNFESITLEYRRLGFSSTGFNSGWETIPYTNIKESFIQNNPVLADTLQAYNDLNFLPGEIPKYFMVWEPEGGNASLFPDGDYEIRARSTCNDNGLKNFTFSNVLEGKIDRQRLQLFGLPQPSDGIWIPGDEISVTFNKNLDCISISDQGFQQKYLSATVGGVDVPGANFTCFNNEIMVTIPNMSLYDGQIMTISVDSITDPNGNLAFDIDGITRMIAWDFLVTTQKAYWEEDSLIVELYEGESITLQAGIRNTELQTTLTGLQLASSTNSSLWLEVSPNPLTTFDINPGAVRPVSFVFSGTQVGTQYDTILVNNIPGGNASPALPIKLITLKQPPFPPDWEVDDGLFPNSMTVVCNYGYTPEVSLSTDTMDLITAWIDNSLRGVARISQLSADDFAAYLTVFGNPSDAGKEIEFRIWDASTDEEFNGYVDPSLQYQQSAFFGLSTDPVVLSVDRDRDAARYIPLQQGFTWISFNSEEEDMSVNHALRSLTRLSPGDRIIGQDGFAEYVNSTMGWIADPDFMLETISTEESYMIFLENGPDTIRITGVDALPYTKLLREGTNWIGFPSQIALQVEDAIGVNSLANVTMLRNKQESRLSPGNEWTDGNLTQMVPHDGYQLTVSQVIPLTVPGVNPPGKDGLDEQAVSRNFVFPADPWDASTWTLTRSEYAFNENIPFVGGIRNGDIQITNQGAHRIAAFIGSELRGVANVNEITGVDKDLFTLLIGVNDFSVDTLFSFYYYDGVKVTDSIEISTSDLLTTGNGRYNYMSPFDYNLCKPNKALLVDKHRLEGVYSASNEIRVEAGHRLAENKIVEFRAPLVKFEGEVNTEENAIMIIKNDGCTND